MCASVWPGESDFARDACPEDHEAEPGAAVAAMKTNAIGAPPTIQLLTYC